MSKIEEKVLGPSGEYRYNLSTTGHSSHRYGNCAICKQHATEVFMQFETKKYSGEGLSGWTAYGCHDYFGHEECLKSQRR